VVLSAAVGIWATRRMFSFGGFFLSTFLFSSLLCCALLGDCDFHLDGWVGVSRNSRDGWWCSEF